MTIVCRTIRDLSKLNSSKKVPVNCESFWRDHIMPQDFNNLHGLIFANFMDFFANPRNLSHSAVREKKST